MEKWRKKDRRVPQDQVKRMIAALTKTGRKPESLFISNLGHTFGDEKQRAEFFQSVTRFLEANLGPGVP
jgi:dipeptidyl aminopeptidase/acylaminoacyl peptidase